MPASPAPLLLALDGNSLLHRAYHAAATGRLLDRDDRPVWAIKGLVGYLARAAARLGPDAVLVGFDCPDHSVRKVDYPAYKAHRPTKAADLAEQIAAAPDLLRATGVCTVLHRAYEADDVLASSAARARRDGWRCVVMTSDRDAFALIDPGTSVLRVRNGGLDESVMVTPATLAKVYGVEPRQYPDYAALRGDPSDNLPGVRGFGSRRAAALLAAFGTIEAAWAALEGGDAAAVRAVVGEATAGFLAAPAAREIVARNRRLMRMRADLPLPELDAARLPLDRASMRRALAARGIILGPSLWALTGGSPPQEPPADDPPVPAPRWSPRGRRREPLPGQLTLF
ncbi:5'-3' exonuclease [Rhizomonospora bruguierae]|uniref:5'-3' exonuclease n=1 Tax=Rhizomonospora bruguierae TaxID=1581705 RepID=UPI001BCCDF59|nr:5'-3' exonuclease H3TH domain-containing protein [Micromonospora sp. NBRC 107566]